VSYEFKAVDDLVDQMKRGDQLTLIPITGDAMSETPGHVLHFAAPTEREPYDHDLTVFRQRAHEQINGMQDAAIAHPSERTDILGALDLAKQELENSQVGEMKQTLMVYTDFLEDDGIYRFAVDPTLVSDTGARELAEQVQKDTGFTPSAVCIRLSLLQSTDLSNLAPQRKKAIRTFWIAYLSHGGTTSDCLTWQE
jgi:hypothetical protein